MMGIAAAGVGYVLLLRSQSPVLVLATTALGATQPALGIAFLAGFVAISRWRKLVKTRSDRDAANLERLSAVDLVASGVEAGVSFDLAVESAIRHVRPPADGELASRLRLRHRGEPPPVDQDHSLIDAMFATAASSSRSGAPVSGALRTLTNSERQKLATLAQERLERLPVKVLFPLAFLILPGFLLVAVVPAVLGGVSKLVW